MTNSEPPTDLAGEAPLNHRLALDRPGRAFVPIAGSRWGELILPAPEEARTRPGAGLRVVMFASFEFGYLAVEAVKAYARKFPDRVQLVGLVTDDPVNLAAHIGLKKRVWKYLDQSETVGIETAIVESALSDGVPTFTGEIKTDGFRALLESWSPDAILSCVFGQVIDAPIIDRPAFGIYNFHPADLAHGYGAGPAPAADLAARGATSTVWTIHQVSEAVDAGHIVATSPAISVQDLSGALPADPLVIYDKLTEPVGWLTACLVDALARQFAGGTPGSLDHLEVAATLPAALQARMLEPIRADHHDSTLPRFDPGLLTIFEQDTAITPSTPAASPP
jgi:folate-dependent phosphoribosylglycinamide formyltransferase PurN